MAANLLRAGEMIRLRMSIDNAAEPQTMASGERLIATDWADPRIIQGGRKRMGSDSHGADPYTPERHRTAKQRSAAAIAPSSAEANVPPVDFADPITPLFFRLALKRL